MSTNITKKSSIKEFFITKLFEESDVRITFDSQFKILVAENGCGKTTILNTFYALLSGDESKLRRVSFDEVGVKFRDGVEVKLNKQDFNPNFSFIEKHTLLRNIAEECGQDIVLELINDLIGMPFYRIVNLEAFQIIKTHTGLPTVFLREELRDILRDFKINHRRKNRSGYSNNKIETKFKTIRAKLGLKTLYLPTYRRVEEDIREFSSLIDKEFKHSSINFGIADVQENIKIITTEIVQSSAESFSKINGQILNQFINGFDINEEMRNSVSDAKLVKIVLDRIKGGFTENHKKQILDMIKSEEINDKKNDALVCFLGSLLEVYKKQQDNDEAIKNFAESCNKYLVDKQIIYDESAVEVIIRRKKSKRKVSFESLSSGEKQIISLFSTLYLQKKDNLAIFFDEPELSLSIEWQKTLLPDILKSEKCKFLFATTHSPFIFENELQKYTVDLSEYMKEL